MKRLCALTLLALASVLAVTWSASPHRRRAIPARHALYARIEVVPAAPDERNAPSFSTARDELRAAPMSAPLAATGDKQTEERAGLVFRDNNGIVLLSSGDSLEGAAVKHVCQLDSVSSTIFQDVELPDGVLECVEQSRREGVHIMTTARLWMRARVQVGTGTLIEILSVEPISREWMQAYVQCVEQANVLEAIAKELPGPSKATRFTAQRDLALKAFADLLNAPDGPLLPERLACHVKNREWTHGEEVALRDRLEGGFLGSLVEYWDFWDTGLREWVEPPMDENKMREDGMAAFMEEGETREGCARLGMDTEELNEDERRLFVMTDGIRVRRVEPFSLAAGAGILPGDLLWNATLSDDDDPLQTLSLLSVRECMGSIAARIRTHNPHDFIRLHLSFLRGRTLMQVTIEAP